MSEKTLLVGEVNPLGTSPRMALYFNPPNSAGGRLCRKILKADPVEYMKNFERVNLCYGAWDLAAAVAEAERIIGVGRAGRPVVLLGSKVAQAFDLPFDPFTIRRRSDLDENLYAIIPHPSGLNRMWNEKGSYAHARESIEAVGRLFQLSRGGMVVDGLYRRQVAGEWTKC